MLDEEGYRPNVGIVLCNRLDHVFWARRAGHDGWQFPQGGVRPNETPEQAMYRELEEEIGLQEYHVELIGRTADWLHYDVPSRIQRRQPNGFKGQKQIWFLLRFVGAETDVCLDRHEQPEFDDWQWVEYWEPLNNIVAFKRDVYQRALSELEPLLKYDY
jgi:putative (di)nucleoside polyphosphate hydrolase